MTNSQDDKMTKQEYSDLNVKIPKPILRKVKARAADEGKTLKEKVAELLAYGIANQPQQTGAGQ
jgi:hypothetical protein